MKLILILGLLIFFSCTKKDDIKVKNINLNEDISENIFDSIFIKTESFYLEDGEKSGIGYLRNLIPIEDKYLFVFDANLNEPIKIFDLRGKFLGLLGTVGEGPGEYKFPIGVQADNKYLYLYDDQLRRVSIFDKFSFSYLSSFKTKYLYTGMYLNNAKIIMKQQNWSENQTTVGKFDIYNKTGEMIGSFSLKNNFDPKEIKLRMIPELNFGCMLFKNKYLVYIDMLEYKLTYFNLLSMRIEWQAQLVNIKPGDKEQSIFSLQNTDNHTIVLEMGTNFFFFNEKGEFISKIKLPDRFIPQFFENKLLTATQPAENGKGEILNPKITIYEMR